jgi:hypothetical protein
MLKKTFTGIRTYLYTGKRIRLNNWFTKYWSLVTYPLSPWSSHDNWWLAMKDLLCHL